MEIERLNKGVADLEGEVWKVVNHLSIGCYDNYAVSNFGRLKVFNFKKTGEEKLLKAGKDKDGYLRIGLWRSGKLKRTFIHRLVALMFIPNPENLPCINHKSEIKTDNKVENLEWCSVAYNNAYGSKLERFKRTIKTSDAWKEGIEKKKETLKNSIAFKEACKKNGEKQRKKVYQYTTDFQLVNIYPSLMECTQQTGFLKSGISACALGKRKTAYKFIWSYSPLHNSTNQLTLFTETKVS